jgi:hypothetical protein
VIVIPVEIAFGVFIISLGAGFVIAEYLHNRLK